MYDVRYINEYDYEWLYEQMGVYGGWGLGALPDGAYVLQFCQRSAQCETALVVERDGERAGFISWTMAPHDACAPEARVAIVSHWYVAQEHRNTRSGYLLIRKFHDIMRKRNISHTIMTLSPSSEVSDKTMNRMGYAHYKTLFIKEVR